MSNIRWVSFFQTGRHFFMPQYSHNKALTFPRKRMLSSSNNHRFWKRDAELSENESDRKSDDTMIENDKEGKIGSNGQLNFSIKNSNGIRMTGEQYLSHIANVLEKHNMQLDSEHIPMLAFNSLLSEYDKLLKESSDLTDRYKRALAETENVRNRGQRQVDDAKLYGIQNFCKDLLEVPDILNVAIDSVPENELDSSATLKSLHSGLTMTRTVLLKTFAKYGLTPVSPLGDKFDPNIHSALFEIAASESEISKGHVGHVAKIGYSLHGRPIRPAQVGVVKQE